MTRVSSGIGVEARKKWRAEVSKRERGEVRGGGGRGSARQTPERAAVIDRSASFAQGAKNVRRRPRARSEGGGQEESSSRDLSVKSAVGRGEGGRGEVRRRLKHVWGVWQSSV